MFSLKNLLILTSFLLLLLSPTSTSATSIGVTYDLSNPNLPPPDHVIPILISNQISTVHLLNPTPSAVRSFAYTNISLLITIPNKLLPSLSSNRSSALNFLYTFILPFHPRSKISLLSLGNSPISSIETSSPSVDPSTVILPAMRNLHSSLVSLGIKSIKVSTTFTFIDIMTNSFPPSSAEFQEPVNSLVIRPVLEFLTETNSSFLVNLYPYNVYRINAVIPIGFALFEENAFNFRDDLVTGVRYWNLFDMMVDSVVAGMAVSGFENVPVVVTETGWPGGEGGGYAEMYLRGLVRHCRSGLGTPLRKEGVDEVYVYQLFDEGKGNGTSGVGVLTGNAGHDWGIMYPNNMSMKYKIDFSGGYCDCCRVAAVVRAVVFVCFVTAVMPMFG